MRGGWRLSRKMDDVYGKCYKLSTVKMLTTRDGILKLFFVIGYVHHTSFPIPNGMATFRREPH